MKLSYKKSSITTIIIWGLASLSCLIILVMSLIEGVFTSEVIWMSILIILIFVLSSFNLINLICKYREYVVIDDGNVTINYGLIFKRKHFKLSDVDKVKYSRYNIAFYLKNGEKRNVDLYYISKRDVADFINGLSSLSVKLEN